MILELDRARLRSLFDSSSGRFWQFDVVVNPDEPPMPSRVTYEQAKGFAEAFLKGQPRRATIASTLFRDKLDQLRS